MSTEHQYPDGEHQFVIELFEKYADQAIAELGKVFLGHNKDEFADRLVVNLNDEFASGNVIPTVVYESQDDCMMVNIEPSTVLNYVGDQLKLDEDDEVTGADFAKIIVGSGIARAIIARKAAKLNHPNTSLESQERYHDKICDKTALWKAVDTHDGIHGTKLRQIVDRLGDTELPRINVIRFIFGASLNYLPSVPGISDRMTTVLRSLLEEEEENRSRNLDTNLYYLEPSSAFALYDDALPEVLWGLSFPMTPAEELTSFFAEALQ